MRGSLCGAIAGLAAGFVFGSVYAALGAVWFALPAYSLTGALLGGITGGMVGSITGLALPMNRPVLKQVCQGIGVLVVTAYSLVIPFSVQLGWPVILLSAIVIGLTVGLAGGTVAYHCYVRLYEQ